MSAFDFLSRETSCRLDIGKVGGFQFKHSSPDHQTVKAVMVGVGLLSTGVVLAVHYSEPIRDFASKVVDRNKSTTEESVHTEAPSPNGKSHDHVQPDADTPVREPI